MAGAMVIKWALKTFRFGNASQAKSTPFVLSIGFPAFFSHLFFGPFVLMPIQEKHSIYM